MNVKIRAQQMDLFGTQADAALIDKLVFYLQDEQADNVVELPRYSCLLEEVPENSLKEMIRNGIKRAGAHGLTWESSIADFISLMFSVAPNFDEHLLVAQGLKNEQVPVDERVDFLFKIISEEIWETATEGYNPAA